MFANQTFDGTFIRYLALWNFAAVYPVWKALSESPDFFAAHGADQASIVLALALQSLAPPAILAAAEGLAGRVSVRFGRAVSFLFAAVLCSAAVIQFLRPLVLSAAAELAAAAVLGSIVGAALSTPRGRPAVFALLPIVAWNFALPWLNRGDATAAEFGNGEAVTTWSRANGTPVVLLVFDQLPTAALLDERSRIDRRRWPALADLADTAVWYRNATTVSTETVYSVPAILSGRYSRERVRPDWLGHPKNLLALLSGVYSINAFETMTSLERLPMSRHAGSRPAIAAAMTSDSAIVLGRVLAPAEFQSLFPSVDSQPAFFRASDRPDNRTARGTRSAFADRRDLLGQTDAFVASLAIPDSLNFLHQINPHHPWRFAPPGRQYTDSDVIAGIETMNHEWPESPGVALGARQRHLLQAFMVDRVIGRIVERLKETSLFDRSMLIITSDHGVSFVPGSSPRQPTMETYLDIIYVPLIIKYPNQREGRVDDANVEAVDIAPTIADVLEASGDVAFDGCSLRDRAANRGSVKTFQSILSGEYELKAWPTTGNGEFTRIKPQIDGMEVRSEGPWVRPRTPCDHLIGGDLAGMASYLVDAREVEVRRNDAPQGYGGIKPDEFRQGWIRGKVDVASGLGGDPLIAVSVNNQVREVVRTFTSRTAFNEFSVHLPEPLAESEMDAVRVDVLRPDHPVCGVAASSVPRMDAEVSFSIDDAADIFGVGWSSPERSRRTGRTWRWATGGRSELFLALPKRGSTIRFRAWTHEANPAQRIVVKVDGATVHAVDLPAGPEREIGPILVPADPDRPRVSLLEFEFAQSNQANANDQRALAVGFFHLKVE